MLGPIKKNAIKKRQLQRFQYCTFIKPWDSSDDIIRVIFSDFGEPPEEPSRYNRDYTTALTGGQEVLLMTGKLSFVNKWRALSSQLLLIYKRSWLLLSYLEKTHGPLPFFFIILSVTCFISYFLHFNPIFYPYFCCCMWFIYLFCHRTVQLQSFFHNYLINLLRKGTENMSRSWLGRQQVVQPWH